MTPKQECFVQEYLVDLCATQAAVRAGYSKKTARQIGDENLSKPYIKAAVDEALAKRAEKTELSQQWVIEQLRANLAAAMASNQLSAANRALELLGKHLGMFTDKVEHSGSLETVTRLEVARRIAWIMSDIDGETRTLEHAAEIAGNT